MLFDSNPAPMWVLDPETFRYLAVNEAAVRLYGYTREEFARMHAVDVLHPAQRDSMADAPFDRRVGLHSWGEWRHQKKSGEEIIVEITTHDVSFGGRQAWLVLGSDITAARRSEAALRESHSLLSAVIEGTVDGVFVKGLDGRYVMVNRAGAAIFGRPVEEVIGRTDADMLEPSSAAEVVELDREVHESGETRTYESVATTVSGDTRTILSTRIPWRDTEGRVKGIIGVSRDLTERKQLEERLRQAQKMDAVGRLAGGVAHDFNNLLTGIKCNVALLLDAMDADDPRRDDVAEVEHAADRAAALTQQLLAFSRKQVLQPKVLDLNALVADTGRLLKRLVHENVQQLTMLDPAAGRVLADPGQMEQVLVNLAVNARDAMPEGGVLRVRTRQVHLDEAFGARHATSAFVPGQYVMLSVSDTGTGMDRATLDRIFEPFFTTKEQGKGTGLGLATVYGIVRQSGGHVRVYSEPGVGTTFEVYLPCVDAADPPVTPAAGTETVLLVEDEPSIRGVAARVLERRGYTVISAAHGEDAISAARAHPGNIDLLLTDVVMPGMSGSALARTLAHERPGLRVLYMSGYTDDDIVHHGVLDAGMMFLEKPFTPRILAQHVRDALDAAGESTTPAGAERG
jgi:PAS domain S-box-containing protein